MNRQRTGFTLIEVLLAATLVVTIVSMVYGSYYTASRSASAYQTRISLSQKAQQVLDQMSRHIRCAYAPTPANSDAPTEANSIQAQPATPPVVSAQKNADDNAVYFRSSPVQNHGDILRIVTTSAWGCGLDSSHGLFDVRYSFDEPAGRLLVSGARFLTPFQEGDSQEQTWQVALEGISGIDLAFYNGRSWQPTWDFVRQKHLPAAVKIALVIANSDGRQSRFSTTVPLYCCDRPAGHSQNSMVAATQNK